MAILWYVNCVFTFSTEPITGNKRHTLYNSPASNLVSALPQPQSAASKDSDKQPLLVEEDHEPENCFPDRPGSTHTDPEVPGQSRVDIDETKKENTIATFMYSETNVASKTNTYSEKVAMITQEIFENHEKNEEIGEIH